MNKIFKDYFSDDSEKYNNFRPKYPKQLFLFLSSISQEDQLAWDCATGSGQSAIELADYFSTIIATDASSTQIKNAEKKSGINYFISTAEDCAIKSNSVDLITVAQAFHWFNHDAYIKEVNRVLKVDGLITIWTYNLVKIQSDIDDIIYHLYNTTLRDFWPKERAMVENNYQDIQLPFVEINAPKFIMSADWNMFQLLGYLETWSAVNEYQKQHGINPIEKIQEKILEIWGNPENIFSVKWPLTIRIWKK